MKEYIYTPDLKATKKHTDKGAPKPEEILVYPILDKDGKHLFDLFDDDDETIIEKDQKVGKPDIWYKVEVKR
ncbi:hypothetical protein [Candidatus Magnetobacterium casense]|uniref:Uncharacterized protein n=1 Tax=Candidatus Magnetobacterium casense TaxID=1455061 RepID=A0ABS6S482_9BACT|nr:hypothetical protein [Candidatus Magnetobacterium casensis]MBV6343662.1 hypothetical protein [Candidatus Magnetobacterium casensis]